MAWFHRQPFFLFFGAEISLPLGAHRRADRGLSGALQRLPFSSWLMFFYVSVTLLLLAHVPPAARWLGWFAWPGRAALTSYFRFGPLE